MLQHYSHACFFAAGFDQQSVSAPSMVLKEKRKRHKLNCKEWNWRKDKNKYFDIEIGSSAKSGNIKKEKLKDGEKSSSQTRRQFANNNWPQGGNFEWWNVSLRFVGFDDAKEESCGNMLAARALSLDCDVCQHIRKHHLFDYQLNCSCKTTTVRFRSFLSCMMLTFNWVNEVAVLF